MIMCVQKRLKRGEWLVKSVPSHRQQQFGKPVITRHTIMVSKCLQELINAIQARRVLNIAPSTHEISGCALENTASSSPRKLDNASHVVKRRPEQGTFLFLMSHVPTF